MATQLPRLLIVVAMCLCFQGALAQRNLIDVPSADIVEAKKLFFQEQISFLKDEVNTSTTFTFGLGHGLELGVTINQLVFQRAKGVEVNVDEPDHDPDLLMNAQKVFEINESVKVGVGTRSGVAAARSYQKTKFVNFNYATSQFTFGQNEHKLVAGVYYGNDVYVVHGTNLGGMAGFDFVLVKDKLNFIGDFFSGNNLLSVINTGFEISLPKEWSITIGAQFPVPGTDNKNAALLQISKN